MLCWVSARRWAADRRGLCTSVAGATQQLQQRVQAELDNLIDIDWVDTDELKGVDLAVETADNLINEYRSIYSAGTTPHDKLFKDVALLYRTKEAATIVEAYAQLSEKVMRKHEGMVGWVVGNNTEIPEGEGDMAIEVLRDYVALMGSLEDESIQDKVDLELGRKMVHLKSMLSMENFSVEIAPIAGDRLLPETPKPKAFPTQPDQKLPAQSS